MNHKVIEDWHSLSPLSNLERQSIHSIQKAVNDKPLPTTLTLKNHSLSLSPPSTRSSSPHSNSLRRLLNQQSTDHSRLLNHSSVELPQSPSNHHQPISSIDRFNDWFSIISSQIEADAESDYLNHLAVLSTYSNACDSLDRVIDDCRGLLNEVDANWKFVNENSKSIERSCEGMLNDQKLLSGIATALNHRLEYFRKLDHAQKVLSRPGQAQIVNDPEFLPMVERLDVCLEFMKSNRHFRDADLYLVRFQQCLTRSMTLIKLHYTNQVQSLGKQVHEKLQLLNQQSTTTSSSSNNLKIEQGLIYEKFEQLSNELGPLITQVENRFEFDPVEYGDLLKEFFQIWFSVRNTLLNPRIKLEIHRIQITHEQVPDLISLTTTGCNYLRSTCLAEWQLFKSFFPRTGEEELFAYLESLSDYLYDLLRPQILHEQKLDLLCDLATIMNALIAIDSEIIIQKESSGNDDVSTNFKFSSLLRPILQDIQTRLIFRAQAIIHTDVENFQPKLIDLDYPNKLIINNPHYSNSTNNIHHEKSIKKLHPNSLHQQQLDNNNNLPLKFKLPDDKIQQTWFPTLRKTLWVLSKLHTYVNDAIFEDFAGEAVGICSESIIKASRLIRTQGATEANVAPAATSSKKKTMMMVIEENEWSIDRDLFVIRHLLILKEMIRSLHVTQVERAVDLGPITDVLKEILNPSIKDSLIFKPITLINKLKNLNYSSSNNNKLQNQNQLSVIDDDDKQDNPSNYSYLIKTIDGKSELDEKIKFYCHSFITKSAKFITHNSIDEFLNKCEKILNKPSTNNNNNNPQQEKEKENNNIDKKNLVLSLLIDQDWSSSENILITFNKFLLDLNINLRFILNKLLIYFPTTPTTSNPTTTTTDHEQGKDVVNESSIGFFDFNLINVLFPSLQEEIMEKYNQFFNLIQFELTELNLIQSINNNNNKDDNDEDNDEDIERIWQDGYGDGDGNLNLKFKKILSPQKIIYIIQFIVYHLHLNT